MSRAGFQNTKNITSVAVVLQGSVKRPGNNFSVVVCQVGKEGKVAGICENPSVPPRQGFTCAQMSDSFYLYSLRCVN